MTVLAAHTWRSNAELIADVAKLGYLDGRVLDVTYGLGTFWKMWRPDDLTACDLDPAKSPIGYSVDFTNLLPAFGGRSFEAIVLDPPYKLNGTPDGSIDGRYGVHEVTTAQDRIDLMLRGVTECSHFLAGQGHLLVKCQDQVCSGRMWWQTDLVTKKATACGLVKVDRFDLLGKHRPQPMEGRRQKHAHGRPSTLLVFRRQP